MIPDPFIYGIVVGLTSAGATVVASRIASRATSSSAKSSYEGVTQQISFQIASKKAEFRQAWINTLRDAMANLQSYGVTPELNQAQEREFYMYGTKIELLMNREDPNYSQLQEIMYRFLEAKTVGEKFACNAPFVRVCQDILKAEWKALKDELANSDGPPPAPIPS